MKVVAGMCILPQREERAKIALDSIAYQVDIMEVAWQSDTIPIPEWITKIDNVVARQTDNSRAGVEKFLTPIKYSGDTIWFGVDDDIEYPEGYIDQTLLWLEALNYPLVSYHGRIANSYPMQSHYRDTSAYPCLGTVGSVIEVDFVGSGVSAFMVGKMKLTEEDFPIINAEDITLSTAAYKNGMKSYVLPHPEGWLQYDHDAVKLEDTIYGWKVNDDSEVTEHANRLLEWKRLDTVSHQPVQA
jgi:hypothetical protein